MTYRVSRTSTIDAPAHQVYNIIADYRDGHPHILPPAYFSGLAVEKGGVGDGTIVRFSMHIAGRKRCFRSAITEPSAGRVLVETEVDSGARTAFTVIPSGEGSSIVTITSELRGRTGFAGTVERILTSSFLKRVYLLELRRLSSFIRDDA